MKKFIHRRYIWALCFFFIICSGCAGYHGSGGSSPPATQAASASSDTEIGKKIFEKLKQELKFTQNPLIQIYVERVGQRLLDHAPAHRFKFRYFVIKSDQLNAFALPNGYIFLTERLLNAVKTEDELAFVIGHETGHVIKSHFRRLMAKKNKVDLATMTAMVAGVLLAKDNDLMAAIQAFSIGGNQSFFLKYSREFEDEADEAGFTYLTAAGYQGQGAIDFMEKLRQLDRITITPPAYLSTHPPTSERLYHLEQMNQRSLPHSPSKPVGDIARFHIWTRLETEHPQEYCRDLNKNYQNNPNDLDTIYGLALVTGKLGRIKKSENFFQKCLKINPHDNDVLRDLGISLFRQGEYRKAQKYLDGVGPNDFLALHYLGRVLKKINQPTQAIAKLSQSKELRPDFPENYYFLGLLYQQRGQLKKAHQNFSTYFSLKGNHQAAQFHRQEADRANETKK